MVLSFFRRFWRRLTGVQAVGKNSQQGKKIAEAQKYDIKSIDDQIKYDREFQKILNLKQNDKER